jgi:hypothetical protein
MTLLDQLAQISTIVQAVLVILSLGLILLQLRQNAELAEAANAQALVEHAGSFNAPLIQSPELAQLWYSMGGDLQKETDAQRYRELLVQWLIFHENIYYQRRKKLLDSDICNSWRGDLKATVQRHNIRQVSDFVAFLKTRYPVTQTPRKAKRTKLGDKPFIGMWRDREDMKDSSAWVRRVRESEWERCSGGEP